MFHESMLVRRSFSQNEISYIDSQLRQHGIPPTQFTYFKQYIKSALGDILCPVNGGYLLNWNHTLWQSHGRYNVYSDFPPALSAFLYTQ